MSKWELEVKMTHTNSVICLVGLACRLIVVMRSGFSFMRLALALAFALGFGGVLFSFSWKVERVSINQTQTMIESCSQIKRRGRRQLRAEICCAWREKEKRQLTDAFILVAKLDVRQALGHL